MLTWHPAEDVRVTYMSGGILLARSLQATGTVSESTAGMVLRIRSDMYGSKATNLESFCLLACFSKSVELTLHLLQPKIERLLTGQS